MTPKVYTLLGRTGDILSILPVLHAEFKNGNRCALMVAKEFAGIMDGISYADKFEYAGQCYEIDRAMASAWQLSPSVQCVQVAGPPELVKKFTYQPAGLDKAVTDSFVKEAWKCAGRFELWKTQPPLIFDRRDTFRETTLLEAFPKKKKVILVSADGKTSPFPYRDLLFKILQINFQPKYVVVDLARFEAERIYDLLALYERVHCLVACDSAPLHLAQACPNLPVVALANDTPSLWHGSPWRANHICYIRYKDFASRAVEMLDAIEGIGGFGTMRGATPEKRVIHAWSQYDIAPDNKERHQVAVKSWQEQYRVGNWVAAKIDYHAVGRDSKTLLKDERAFPGLKEVIRLASFRARDEDIICLTRADTCWENLKLEPPCYAHRTLTDDAGGLTWHPAVDLFAFTKLWWDEHGRELPDLVMGYDFYWHRCLMELIRKYGGKDLGFVTHRDRAKGGLPPMERNYAIHNEKLAREWLTKQGRIALFPAVATQIETIQINPAALNPYGYNPSIIRHDGRLLMAYRYHTENKLSTQLALAELDDKFQVTRNSKIEVGGNQSSVEDPRLFTYRGKLWMSYVCANWPSKNPVCVTKYGPLEPISSGWGIVPHGTIQPECGRNDGKALEKNWLFWEQSDHLFWLWKNQTEKPFQQIIYRGDKQEPFLSDAPRWPWGEIRGGCLLPWKGQLLRFFHSSLDFEQPPARRRYFMGAAVMEAVPPFKTVAVSKEPICYGSELDAYTPEERAGSVAYKEKVIFPAGVVMQGDEFLVSAGCNDAACLLLKVKEKNLNL